MFTPTLRCECAQPASDRLMRKWCIGLQFCMRHLHGIRKHTPLIDISVLYLIQYDYNYHQNLNVSQLFLSKRNFKLANCF